MIVRISSGDLNKEKLLRILEISAESVKSCYQCGKCTAGCPMLDFMEIPPHLVVRLLQLGQVDEVLNKNTIWMCASCITCAVRCPMGVDLAKVMEALRLSVLRANVNRVNPSRLSAEELGGMPQIALIAGFRKFTS